jgi:uncharacterized RmlC-like cupin family protein
MTGSHDHTGSDHSHDHSHDHAHDEAQRWKHDGVRVIPGDQLDPNVPSTAGMDRKAAINFARVGAQKLWAGTVTIKPDAKTGAHHHGHLESIIYVVKGKARMRWGEHLQFMAEANPGDFIFIPPYVSMPVPTRCSNACWCAATARRWRSISTSSRWKNRRRCCGSIPCTSIRRRGSDVVTKSRSHPGARASANPGSRDSGFDATRRPGMTARQTPRDRSARSAPHSHNACATAPDRLFRIPPSSSQTGRP